MWVRESPLYSTTNFMDALQRLLEIEHEIETAQPLADQLRTMLDSDLKPLQQTIASSQLQLIEKRISRARREKAEIEKAVTAVRRFYPPIHVIKPIQIFEFREVDPVSSTDLQQNHGAASDLVTEALAEGREVRTVPDFVNSSASRPRR